MFTFAHQTARFWNGGWWGAGDGLARFQSAEDVSILGKERKKMTDRKREVSLYSSGQKGEHEYRGKNSRRSQPQKWLHCIAPLALLMPLLAVWQTLTTSNFHKKLIFFAVFFLFFLMSVCVSVAISFTCVRNVALLLLLLSSQLESREHNFSLLYVSGTCGEFVCFVFYVWCDWNFVRAFGFHSLYCRVIKLC